MRLLGIDVGGTRIKAGLLADDGKVVDRRMMATEAQEGREAVLERLVDVIKWGLDEGAEAVGVAFASPMDPEKGVIYNPPNLPGFGVFPIRDYLKERVGIDVVIENDANAYMLGEWWMGAGRGSKVLLGVTLGTGIGGALIVEGKVWHGAHGLGGEFGHVVIWPDGPECNCGNRGCFEAVASSRYLMEVYRRLSGEGITPEEIYRRALSGDAAALESFRILGRNVAMGLAGLANALDPDRVVIGGGLANAGMLLLEQVRMHFYPLLLSGIRDRVELCLAELGDMSAVVGVAYLAKKLREVVDEGNTERD